MDQFRLGEGQKKLKNVLLKKEKKKKKKKCLLLIFTEEKVFASGVPSMHTS